jgi:hypothetical protein
MHSHRYRRALMRRRRERVLCRGTRRMAEAMAKFTREMGVIAKATGEGDLAQRLACSQRRPAMQKVRGVIQTERVYMNSLQVEARAVKSFWR